MRLIFRSFQEGLTVLVGSLFAARLKYACIYQVGKNRIQIILEFMTIADRAAGVIQAQGIVKTLQKKITRAKETVRTFFDPEVRMIIDGDLFVLRFLFLRHLFGLFFCPGNDLISGHIHLCHKLRHFSESGNDFSGSLFTVGISIRFSAADIAEVEILLDINGFGRGIGIQHSNSHR